MEEKNATPGWPLATSEGRRSAIQCWLVAACQRHGCRRHLRKTALNGRVPTLRSTLGARNASGVFSSRGGAKHGLAPAAAGKGSVSMGQTHGMLTSIEQRCFRVDCSPRFANIMPRTHSCIECSGVFSSMCGCRKLIRGATQSALM